jgi:hypothetical protein
MIGRPRGVLPLRGGQARPAWPSTKDEDQGGNGALDATFTRVKSFDELFGEPQDEALRNCRTLLEAEALDVALAAQLDAAQLGQVLAGEPLGHVMRVKNLLAGAHVAVAPPSVGASAFARFISASTLRDDLHPSLLVWFEVSVVMASLLFTVAISQCLSPVQSCAFEDGAVKPSSSCNTLVWADSVLWFLSTVCLLMAALICWMDLYHVLSLTREELPRWLVRNAKSTWLGLNLAVQSFFTFFGGVATRCMLNQQNKLRGQMMAGAALFSCAVGFAWWFSTARAVHGFALSPRTLVTFQLGQFGFGLATKFNQLFPGKFATLREE